MKDAYRLILKGHPSVARKMLLLSGKELKYNCPDLPYWGGKTNMLGALLNELIEELTVKEAAATAARAAQVLRMKHAAKNPVSTTAPTVVVKPVKPVQVTKPVKPVQAVKVVKATKPKPVQIAKSINEPVQYDTIYKVINGVRRPVRVKRGTPTTTEKVEPTTTEKVEPTTTEKVEPTTTEKVEPTVKAVEPTVKAVEPAEIDAFFDTENDVKLEDISEIDILKVFEHIQQSPDEPVDAPEIQQRSDMFTPLAPIKPPTPEELALEAQIKQEKRDELRKMLTPKPVIFVSLDSTDNIVDNSVCIPLSDYKRILNKDVDDKTLLLVVDKLSALSHKYNLCLNDKTGWYSMVVQSAIKASRGEEFDATTPHGLYAAGLMKRKN
jgi:hypothetical protein